MLDWNVSHQEKYMTLVRLLIAAALGGLLGWERSRAEKPVGVRTMMLISTGAAAFALLGEQIVTSVPEDQQNYVQVDSTRVLAYIVTGVGFIGAGAILHSKKSVKGLTTASSIWVGAAVGAASGLGEYMIGFFLFAIAFVALWFPWVIALATGNLRDYEVDDLRHENKDKKNGSEPSSPITDRDRFQRDKAG